MNPSRVVRPGVAAAAALVLAACAPGRPVLPTGSGVPFAGVEEAFRQATGGCRGVRTWTAEIALSGRSGDTKLRGRLIAGLAPGSLFLEAVAPFGRPIFTLVARDREATLLLPRDRRVLRGAAPAAIVEALTGVAVGPDALRALVSGCVAPGEPAPEGRAYPGGWVAVDLAGGAVMFLRTDRGRWRVEAGLVSGLSVEYRAFQGDLPRGLRLRAEPGRSPRVDLTLDLSQVEANVRVPDEAFVLEVPGAFVPMTLEELRAAGPLGDRRPEGPPGL